MKTNLRKIHSSSLFFAIWVLFFHTSNLFSEQLQEQQFFAKEKAIEHLRSTKQYKSLNEAVQVARYSVRELKGHSQEAWAQNFQHNLNATFDSEGLHLKVQTESGKLYQSNWRLKSAGESQIAPGELRHNGQRVEIVRSGLREWFVNRPTGLEHGFTLAHRPATAGEQLRLIIALGGDLKIAVSKDGQRAKLRDQTTGTKVLDYDKLRVWDATGKELPAQMASAKNGAELQLEIEDTHARYPLTIDPTFTQQAFLKASNAEERDSFGSSVAVSGDTVVIGATQEDSNAINDPSNNSGFSTGAAYVFVRNGPTWTEQAYLKAQNPNDFDEFGNSVAISGDTIAVGVSAEDSSALGGSFDNSIPNSGAVVIFVRDGTTWNQQAFLKANQPGDSDRFGASLALSGNRLVVGADQEDSNATGGETNNDATFAGAAYVFERSGETWTQQAFLKASNAERFDRFGSSVAISEDTIVIGARDEESSANGGGDDNSERDSGAAYVFVLDGTEWIEQAFLKADNADADDEFGASVAISGDTIVVGASLEDSESGGADNSISNAGAAYVFVRNGTAWSQQAILKGNNTEGNDRFGTTVTISEGIIAVGADREDGSATGDGTDNSASSSGAVYTFRRSGTIWSQRDYLKASNAEEGDNFGGAVSLSGGTLIIGAIDEASSTVDDPDNNDESDSGAAYIFQLPESPDPQITAIEVESSPNTVTLTWSSIPGATYRVDYSQDLLVWMENLAFGIPHDSNGSGFTSQEINLEETDLTGTERLFLRVVEE